MRHLYLLLLVLIPAHGDSSSPEANAVRSAPARLAPPRRELARTFVDRDSASLRRLLAPDVMIWPPPPDTARRGTAAINYILGLAAATRVTHSEFRPRAVSTESGQTVEDGTWTFVYRGRLVMAKYDLRWRRMNNLWRVSFLKWEAFR